MEVKYKLVNNIEIFINVLCNELSRNNINYLIINYNEYYEVHIENTIYRLIDMKNITINSISSFSIIDALKDEEFINYEPCKKERPGFKKYNKKMIKQDSKRFKTNINRKR